MAFLGISTFGTKPEKVGEDHLKDLFHHAKSIIPKDAVEETPVFLLATAGMRLLTDDQQTNLLNEVCKYTKEHTSFLVTDCALHFKVIPGETEGLYGWLAANYLLGGFDAPDDEHPPAKDHSTYGFLDMGGASAQIAFAPNATESEKHADNLKLVRMRTVEGEPKEYRVFVTTWLGYGANEARRRYVEGLLNATMDDTTPQLKDPCLPAGLTISTVGDVLLPGDEIKGQKPSLLGTGDFPTCLNKTYPLLDKDAPCDDDPCLFHNSHVPLIDFDVNHFVGVSEYWHTTHQIFQYGHQEKAYDFKTYQDRVNEFCSKDWTEIAKAVEDHEWGKKVDEKTAVEVCFKASWLINVLHEGIGIPRTGLEDNDDTLSINPQNGTKDVLNAAKEKGFTESFHAVDEIGDTDVSWTLGKALLYASSQIIEGDAELPVGFGSNSQEKGVKIPDDFQYAALPFRIESSISPSSSSAAPSSAQNSTTTTTTIRPIPTTTSPSSTSSSSSSSETPPPKSSPWKTLPSLSPHHRLPGLLLFSLIAFLLLFFLLGRERRTRLYRRLTGRASSAGASSSSSSGVKYERLGGNDVEAGDFELGGWGVEDDFGEGDDDGGIGAGIGGGGGGGRGSKGLASGWASPNLGGRSQSEVDFGGVVNGRGGKRGKGKVV